MGAYEIVQTKVLLEEDGFKRNSVLTFWDFRVLTECLTLFDGCWKNEKHEVKLSDVAEVVAHSFFGEQSPEIVQLVSRVKQELSSLVQNAEYIARDAFVEIVNSFIARECLKPADEEYFSHTPARNTAKEESSFDCDNNNVTPQQTPRAIERSYREFINSLERKLTSKASEIELLEDEVKRLKTEKEHLIQKIARLEEDIGSDINLQDENQHLESARRSLEIELKASMKKLREFEDREEKYEIQVEELKSQNAAYLKKISRVKDLENQVERLEIQITVLTEDKKELTAVLDSIQKAMLRKEAEEAERSQYIEELHAKIREMVLLQEENDETLGLGFLRVLYDYDRDDFVATSPSTSPLMFEMAAALPASTSSSNELQIVEASTTIEPEVLDEATQTSALNLVFSEAEPEMTACSTCPVSLSRVLIRCGRFVARIVILLFFIFASLYVFIREPNSCKFDPLPCLFTVLQKKFFCYELTGTPPV